MDARKYLAAEEFNFGHDVLVVQTGLLKGQIGDPNAASLVVRAELFNHGVGAAHEVELGSRSATGRRVGRRGVSSREWPPVSGSLHGLGEGAADVHSATTTGGVHAVAQGVGLLVGFGHADAAAIDNVVGAPGCQPASSDHRR